MRAIYALALDATESRDQAKAGAVDAIARAAFKPLREELGGHTPIYEILEYLEPGASSDDDWSYSLDNLRQLKDVYPEVLA